MPSDTSTLVRLASPSPSNGREPGPRRSSGSSITSTSGDATAGPSRPAPALGRTQTAPPDITPASWPSSPRAASGEKMTGAASVGILRAPSLATVRRAASRPTCPASASPAAKRDAVQNDPFRFLPSASSHSGSTANDTCAQPSDPQKPADVGNADARAGA